MDNLSARQVSDIARQLQEAVIKCSERCLYQAAKWAAEMLTSLPSSRAQDQVASPTDTEIDSQMEDIENERPAIPSGVISQNEDLREARLEAAEVHKYLLAKMYFDCREYDRCAAVFLPDTLPQGQLHKRQSPKSSKTPNSKGKQFAPAGSPQTAESYAGDGLPHLSQKSLFLALYAKYLSGEKRKDEESEMILGPTDTAGTINKELTPIMAILGARLDNTVDPTTSAGAVSLSFLEYLYAVTLAKSKNATLAKTRLIRSLNLYEWNWSAYQELAVLLTSTDGLDAALTHLPQNLPKLIFYIYAQQSLFQADPAAFKSLKSLKPLFPASSFLKTQKALLLYHGKDFDRASHIFAKVLAREPYRLDDLDAYSNILYVMESRPQLAHLAHLVTAVDRFRPESACVVGNYYALKSEHEKAILYFRRALTLDRSFLSAWTLMGHEYVELKNTQAAIECYRRAVDTNRKDYRAWYGLGQTYEVLEMHLYALWYYQRAAALCPFDAKMWTAVGACLGKMGRSEQAIGAYKRALEVGSYYESGSAQSSFGSQATARPGSAVGRDKAVVLDPDVLYAIAMVYYEMGEKGEMRAYLELVLAQEEGVGVEKREDGVDAEANDLKSSILSTASGGGPNSSGSGHGDSGVGGIGVTATTSRARHLLCKLEMEKGGKTSLTRALDLANELCQDGWEVEDAKALMRDIRGRLGVETRA